MSTRMDSCRTFLLGQRVPARLRNPGGPHQHTCRFGLCCLSSSTYDIIGFGFGFRPRAVVSPCAQQVTTTARHSFPERTIPVLSRALAMLEPLFSRV